MSAEPARSEPAPEPIAATIAQACRVIAPSWPLDRQIAVNPWWGFIDRPFPEAARALGRLTSGRLTLDDAAYLEAWRRGEVTAAALRRALAEQGLRMTPDAALAQLMAARPPEPGLPLLSDVLDQTASAGSGPSWRDTITQQISQYCASYFDEDQADWHRPDRAGLFHGWRTTLLVDHALESLMQVSDIRARVGEIPDSCEAAIRWAADRLGVQESLVEFLQVCLMRINGWASWCAWLGWEAALAGRTDPHLAELLAIRTCWEALLLDGRPGTGAATTRWREQWRRARQRPVAGGQHDLLVWQRAHEISYHDRLTHLLAAGRPAQSASRPERPDAQLVFCIDVRSERLRRALESCDPGLETLGFAGFFGLPIRYEPLGTTFDRPQLPGLLSPSLQVSESTGRADEDLTLASRRADRLERQHAFQPFLRTPSGAFTLVETLGIGYAAALLQRHFGTAEAPIESLGLSGRECEALRPQLTGLDGDVTARQADLLASILRAMSLTKRFARLLVLVAHGAQSANNPQAAALECGACGGHSGEINARVLARLLNDTPVRRALALRGIDIPADVRAVAALHNTTTDEVTLFDVDETPQTHRAELQRLLSILERAGSLTRAERAPSLGLADLAAKPEPLLRSIRRRARDWAETRPEWGLANNAALIVAPRWRTQGLDLEGRSFLHDYDAAEDPDGRVLELILSAPMVVAHWINLQYYASTVDPARFGSGNKLLHNVACGRIGVFEGNTGDLRIGLARQSIHDGERILHTPLRLATFIDAPVERIERILQRQNTVRQLVDNQWLYLFRFTPSGLEWRHENRWQPWPTRPPGRD